MAKLYKTFFCFYLLPSIILQYVYSYTYIFDKWLGIEKVFNDDSLPYVGFFAYYSTNYICGLDYCTKNIGLPIFLMYSL